MDGGTLKDWRVPSKQSAMNRSRLHGAVAYEWPFSEPSLAVFNGALGFSSLSTEKSM